jgi:cephalosporin hydroxylase
VIEVGTQLGGSALWFRDRLRTLEAYGHICDPRVVTIDVSQAAPRHPLSQADPSYADTIHLIEGDIRDDRTIEAIKPLLGKRCFVVEDSAHQYDTTQAAPQHCSPFVPPGGYFVVEDGCVDIDEMRLTDDWPRGVLPALRDWLKTAQGSDFRVRRDLEIYVHHMPSLRLSPTLRRSQPGAGGVMRPGRCRRSRRWPGGRRR